MSSKEIKFSLKLLPLKVFDRYKLGLDSSLGIQPFKLPLSLQNIIPVTMNKGTHFNGQFPLPEWQTS